MRRFLYAMPVIGAVGLTTWLASAPAVSAPSDVPKSELKPVTALPVSRVVLFSSGVGHFARSGEVTGDARVDLTFPENDINDLIKSMVLQDFSEKGRVAAVTYDSHDPIDRTLKSFAINLNNNPTLSGILNQARGEKVEVALQQNVASQPASLTGSIIGIESHKEKDATIECLNMWCAEGMRSVKLNEVQRIRFSNPIIENEFRRALDVLALSHDSQKKAVSLHFAGEGKRKVQVSYVVENPIWKTSYRLVLDKAGKPFLQGWAVVENPTDEDWNGVQMALVSGRPISFKMDLYNPLYVPRPTVEPELFASLRPPTYGGKMFLADGAVDADKDGKHAAVLGITGLADDKKMALQERLEEPGRPRSKLSKAGAGTLNLPYLSGLSGGGSDEYRVELQKQLAERMDAGRSVNSVATAAALGDYFQYVIDQPVDLARQKSSLLPIVNKEVEADRVSIYNANVQAKHPLLGLVFKNTTGLHLAQGPITVFEGSTYAGDTRVLDLQPKEERLVSYAIDLGTEVKAVSGADDGEIRQVKAVKGVIHTVSKFKETVKYEIANRSDTDRTLLIEHPNRKESGFTFTGANKPHEVTADLFRFKTVVPAGKSAVYEVAEERDVKNAYQITNNDDANVTFFLKSKVASEALKAKLRESLELKAKWNNATRDIAEVNERIGTITKDQERLRQNLREMPKEAEAYKRYLKKFDDQEKEMDDLQAKLKKLQGEEAAGRKAFEDFAANLTME